jgi:hypothetical protein
MLADVLVVSRRSGGVRAPDGYVIVNCDRSTFLGNPYLMTYEKDRDRCCQRYERHLRHAMASKGERFRSLREAIQDIVKLVALGRSVALQCWCAPKRCHADSIKKYVLERLNDQNASGNT